MKISSLLMSGLLVITSLNAFALKSSSSTQIASAKEVLQVQIAELMDLQEQLNAAKKLKRGATIAVWVSSAAATIGLFSAIAAKMDAVKSAVSAGMGQKRALSEIPLLVPETPAAVLVMGGAGVASGSGVLVVLQTLKINELEKQIQTVVAELVQTSAQLK